MTGQAPENIHRDPDKTLDVLFEISEAVNRTRNPGELFAAIHRSLDKLLNVDNFYIGILDPERDAIFFPYHVDEKDDHPGEILNFTRVPSSTAQVIREKKPLIFYEDDIRAMAARLKQDAMGAVSKIWLGAPLIIKNRIIGAIAIQSYRSADAYDRNDLDLLNSVSQHIALAIERKDAEEKLARQNRLLEKLLESSPVGIALTENRVFKWVNQEMVRLFGYDSKTDFESKRTQMLYPDVLAFDAAGRELSASLAKTGKAHYEARLIKRDHTLIPVHIRMNCTDTRRPMARTIAIYTDISQRLAAEKEKLEKEHLRGVLEMAGAICHELNQPLQAISGYSELLIMEPDDGEADKKLHAIRYQAERIDNIARKLAGITRYRTVDYPGNTKIVDIWNADG